MSIYSVEMYLSNIKKWGIVQQFKSKENANKLLEKYGNSKDMRISEIGEPIQ